MENRFPGGSWPVMLTPFTEDNKIDYDGLKELVDWYIKNGVSGMFAVCQSSEMFYLSLDERVKYAAKTVEFAAGRVPVIASGGAGTLEHFYDALTEGGADAALAASLFHYKELEIREVKDYLAEKGISVRR